MNKLNKTILSNENGRKSASGITLIALVITIIVLLILAGITIAMLTGSDSAPAKANEAKQKNDIGSARDQVYLFASNAQTEAYERIYVKGKQATSNADVTAGNASTEVSNYVKNLLKTEYPEDGTKKVGLATIVATDGGATITISTTDWKQEGNVENTGGTLTWKDLTQNIPTPAPVEDTGGDPTAANSVQTLAKAGTIQVGDYVDYNPGTATSDSLTLPSGASIEYTINASEASDWKVINVNQTTGEILILPTYLSYNYFNYEFDLNSVEQSIDTWISISDMVAGIFKNSDYAKSARAVRIEDFDSELISDDYYNEPISSHTNVDGTIMFSRDYEWCINPGNQYYIGLANKAISSDDDGKPCLLKFGDSTVEAMIWGNGAEADTVDFAPVVSLKSGIQMTKDENDVWQLSRGD